MKECLTTLFALSEASGCLVDSPECDYAHKFGFSIVCFHPEHARFHELVADALTKGEVNELYDTPRSRRRDEFTATLGESDRTAFCLQTDFYDQPLINMEEKQAS